MLQALSVYTTLLGLPERRMCRIMRDQPPLQKVIQFAMKHRAIKHAIHAKARGTCTAILNSSLSISRWLTITCWSGICWAEDRLIGCGLFLGCGLISGVGIVVGLDCQVQIPVIDHLELVGIWCWLASSIHQQPAHLAPNSVFERAVSQQHH